MHDCTCCGIPVASNRPTCTACTHDWPGDTEECGPDAWHCDGRYGHSCDGTVCEDIPDGGWPEYTASMVGREDREYWSNKDQ